MQKIAIGKENLKKIQPLEGCFLNWFQNEYLKRRQKNANYSVRAFANYLKISAATVSHLLSGKRQPSAKYAERLFLKLEIDPQNKKIILENLKNKIVAENHPENKKYNLIALDSFKLMSEWYHYAILEMTFLNDFKFDHTWIAQQLNISVTESRQAIDRLLRLDLLEEKINPDTKRKTLIKTTAFLTNGDDSLTSTAHKQLQRHILQKALDAIDHVSIENKDISSMTMAIDEKKIPQAKKLITKFRRDMCDFLETDNQTRLFNLAIQLYPISKINKYKET